MKIHIAIITILSAATAIADTLIFSDDFSTQRPEWTFSINMGYIGMPTPQGNLTQSMINDALAGSFANVSGGTLNLKANSTIGRDWGVSAATLSLQLPTDFRITYTSTKTQWAGGHAFELLESDPTAAVGYPYQENGRFLRYEVAGFNALDLSYEPDHGTLPSQVLDTPNHGNNNVGQTYSYEITKTGNNLQVFRDGSLQYDYSGAIPLDFMNHIRFINHQAGATSLVDNLSVFSVPEPSSFALLGSAIAFFSLRRASRRNRTA